MPGGSRSLPGQPNLRYLKLEARRRVAAGEFPSLHEAQVAIAREHGLPSWATLKQQVNAGQDTHAVRTQGEVPATVANIAEQAVAELGLTALLLAGADPNTPIWILTRGWADLDRAEPLDPGHRFPAPGVTAHHLTLEGRFEPVPARIPTLQAVAGLWSTGADLVRLGLGWSSLLPEALAHEALTPQTDPGQGGVRVGLGWIITPRGDVATHVGTNFDATASVTIRLRDQRTHVVLISRMIPVNTIEARLLRAWTNPI